MVLFNYATKELTAKIVYYGPGLCGKTTNLQFIYDSLPSASRSKMLSLATETDRTLFFDFLPIELGRIRGMRTRLQLYTVPGQVFYNSTRQLVLRGADGVVFVADSQDHALDANKESLQNLEDNLRRQSIRIAEIPLVIQYNKRDLPNILPVDRLEAELNRFGVPSFGSVATTGEGVEETLNGIARVVLTHLSKRYGLEGGAQQEELQVIAPSSPPAGEESVWQDEVVTESAPVAVTADAKPGSSSATAAALESVPLEFNAAALSESTEQSFELNALLDGFQQPLEAVHLDFGAAVEEPSLPPQPAPAPVAQAPAPPPPPSDQGLVKQITLPLNLTLEELQRHRKLKLSITLDVNILR